MKTTVSKHGFYAPQFRGCEFPQKVEAKYTRKKQKEIMESQPYIGMGEDPNKKAFRIVKKKVK